MNENRFNSILLSLTACGYIEGYSVTLKSGVFTYMLPFWCHSLILNIRCFFSQQYSEDVVDVLDYIYEIMSGETLEDEDTV